MAGAGRPGPKPGSGGRPRVAHPKPNASGGGYARTSVGPAGHGKVQYVHRVVASGGTVGGTKRAPKSSFGAKTGIVDHKNRQRSSNGKANLRIVSRSKNNSNKSG